MFVYERWCLASCIYGTVYLDAWNGIGETTNWQLLACIRSENIDWTLSTRITRTFEPKILTIYTGRADTYTDRPSPIN